MYAILVLQANANPKPTSGPYRDSYCPWVVTCHAGVYMTKELAEQSVHYTLRSYSAPTYRVVIAPVEYEAKLTTPPVETVPFKE